MVARLDPIGGIPEAVTVDGFLNEGTPGAVTMEGFPAVIAVAVNVSPLNGTHLERSQWTAPQSWLGLMVRPN